MAALRRRLLAWYRKNKRDLPWRRTRDPYRIWVSEIMLQQTRVAAVIPYYERFLTRFPTVAALASAPEPDLLAAWAGLGYYARARNLQRAAKTILERGPFPKDYASLRELAGIGEYTAAAIASIAFDQPHAVLDGNVIRVLSRLTAEPGNIGSLMVRRRLHEFASRLLDPKRPGEFNQALMEMGATVCLPKQPQCTRCPLAPQCQARARGLEEGLPVRPRRQKPIEMRKQLLVIEKRGKVLLWQQPAASRRLAGFWELPEVGQIPGARIAGKPARFRHIIVNTTYVFEVYRGVTPQRLKDFQWISLATLRKIPLSSTARKALSLFSKA